MIALRNAAAVLELLPEIGGAVARFAVKDVDVLRPAPAGTRNVLETACFPLLPFANRIANGAFTFDGEQIRLPRNFGDHPHALHGQGWQKPWRILSQTVDTATLAYDHVADAWPWNYTAQQAFALSPDALRIALSITNRGGRPMPVSLGLHPYFPRTARTRLQAEVAGVWLSDETCIPIERAPPTHFLDLASGAELASAPFVDHCHFGWRGDAIIEQPEYARVLRMAASAEFGFLHLYIPRDADSFCVEPVSAMPDAANRTGASGLRVLADGESFAASVTLSTQARER